LNSCNQFFVSTSSVRPSGVAPRTTITRLSSGETLRRDPLL